MTQGARFLAVSVIGLGVDLGVSLLLATGVGLPLWLAATVGFLTAAAGNYILHEIWTFRQGRPQTSLRRFGRHMVSLGVTLGVRVGAVLLLQALFGVDRDALAILLPAVGLSFCASFLLARSWVFAQEGPMDQQPPPSPVPNPTDWQVPAHLALSFGPRRHRHALVIPVINEGQRIRSQLQRIAQAGLAVDVVIADGGSTDGSLEEGFLQSQDVRALLTKTGQGKLSAQLRMAYAWCLTEGYQGIITMDGNGKDGVEAVADMVAALDRGVDYAQGSRYLPGGVAENTPWERTLANRLIHAPVLSLAGRHWFTDTTNGYRAYSARFLLDPRVQPFRDVFQRYELLFYLTVRAGQTGMRIADIPVRRIYPQNEATPTKIAGFGGKLAILRQTFAAAFGRFTPR